MKRILVILILVCVAIAFSHQVEGVYGNTNAQTAKVITVNSESMDLINGPIHRPTFAPINNADLPNPDDPTSNQTYPYPLQTPESRKPESPFGWSDWGDDLLVYDGAVGTGQDMDEDPLTEDIYVALDTDHSTMDSIVVLRSTDTGNTWSVILIGTNTDGSIENPKVRILEAGGQTWVAFIGIWVETTGVRNLYMRRIPASGGSATWELLDDSVLVADIDADIGSSAWLYCTYYRQGASWNSIYAARNAMAGAGWQNITNLFVDPQTEPYPAIAAGANGNVAVTFVDDRITTNNEIRIKRSTNYGSTWLSSAQVSNNTGAYAISETDIAYSHGSTQTGWITSTFYVVDNDNLVYYYSVNSGVDWTYGGLIGSSGDDENLSSLRCRKSTGAVTVAYNQDVGAAGDSTMFTWTTASNPTNFTTPVRVNDYSATGYWPPTAGWITIGGGGYSAITYTSWTQSYNCYLDWYSNVGAEEMPDEISAGFVNLAPNPSQNAAKLSYVVVNQGSVNISVYDAAGRIVNNLVNEIKPAGEYTVNMNNQNLAAGIYFIRIETPEGTAGKTMTIVR